MVSRSHPFKGVTHPTPPVHEPFPLSRRILWPAVQPISPAPSGRVCLVTDPGTPPPAPLPTTLHPSLGSSGLLHPDHTPCRLFGPRLHRSCSLTSTQPALGAPAVPLTLHRTPPGQVGKRSAARPVRGLRCHPAGSAHSLDTALCTSAGIFQAAGFVS